MTVLWTAISVAVVAGGLVLALYVLVRWFGAAHRLQPSERGRGT